MTISTGNKLPDATVIKLGEKGPEELHISALSNERKVVIFAVPGAYTPTCHSSHVPSFIRCAEAFAVKNVDEIYCVSVNDPFVMQAWGEATGATKAGITMLADADAGFTKALGLEFSAPPAGLYDRSLRFAMLVEDGVVQILNIEEDAGICEVSAGETLLGMMD